ncbi:MAG: hypothetical protein U0531_13245 [Dehalococcoidia bacterium]
MVHHRLRRRGRGAGRDERFAKNPAQRLTDEQQRGRPWTPGFIKPLTRNMLDQDAPDHTRLRALVHKASTSQAPDRAVARAHPDAVRRPAHHRRPRRPRRSRSGDYVLPLPVTVITEMLGVPPDDRGRFHQWSKRVVTVATPRDLPRALPSLWLFLRFVRRLIARRRAEPADDLLTALIQAEENGSHLTEDEPVGDGVPAAHRRPRDDRQPDRQRPPSPCWTIPTN